MGGKRNGAPIFGLASLDPFAEPPEHFEGQVDLVDRVFIDVVDVVLAVWSDWNSGCQGFLHFLLEQLFEFARLGSGFEWRGVLLVTKTHDIAIAETEIDLFVLNCNCFGSLRYNLEKGMFMLKYVAHPPKHYLADDLHVLTVVRTPEFAHIELIPVATQPVGGS